MQCVDLQETMRFIGSMLTHFKGNSVAFSFYRKHGFDIDWSSPEDKAYVILSKWL